MIDLFPAVPHENLAPVVTPFFDEDTNSYSYVVHDPESRESVVIDSVINFDYSSATISFEGADRIISYVKANDLCVKWILETHVHADHLSAASYIQDQVGGKLGIGEHVVLVQDVYGKAFNEGVDFPRDGSQFDRLFRDGDEFSVGRLNFSVLHTPGHTPACISFLVDDSAFVGDTIFMPDIGTARVDFPGGDAQKLYASIRRILALPSETRLFMCHDYCPNDRKLEFETTVAVQRSDNIHVNDNVNEEEFIRKRHERDAILGTPKLILPSLQINMRAGHLPDPEENGRAYLKLPLNSLTWRCK